MSQETDAEFERIWMNGDNLRCRTDRELAKHFWDMALTHLEAEKEAVVEMCASVCRRVACDCEAARLREGMTAAWKCEDAIKTLSP